MKSLKKRIKELPGVQYNYSFLKGVVYLHRYHRFGKSHSLLSILWFYRKAYKKEFYAKEICYLRYLDLSKEEQAQMVLWEEQNEFYRKVNAAETREILNDKFRAYEYFKDYYKREVFQLTGDRKSDESTFIEFVRRNGKVIIKPMASCQGSGISIIDAGTKTDEDLCRVLGDFADGGVVETLIVQNDVLGVFHPQSVNTLRINTIRYDDEVEVKWPCLRVGRGSTVVDNAGAGGIFAAIDERTGVTIAAADEMGNMYTHHPDSGLSLIGFQIPDWDKACETVRQLALRLPENRFTGWDLAYTDNGWVMVEGNVLPLIIWQIAVGKGIREDFEKMEQRLRLKE